MLQRRYATADGKRLTGPETRGLAALKNPSTVAGCFLVVAPHLALGVPSQKPRARTFFLGASHLKREAPPNFVELILCQ